jgi:hypothetical protein
VNINEQPKPKTLKEVKDGSLLPVQKPELYEVSIPEIKEWANVKRHSVPALFKPQYTFIGITEQPWPSMPLQSGLPPLDFFFSTLASKLVVLRDPEADVTLVQIVLEDVILQSPEPALCVVPIVEFEIIALR